MSQSTPFPGSHGRSRMQNRRLSIIQDTAVDDLHDIDTHALDKNSPPPHHDSSVMSYMESHSPNDESSHKCSPTSPLMSRVASAVGEGKVEMMLEVTRVEGKGKSAFHFLQGMFQEKRELLTDSFA